VRQHKVGLQGEGDDGEVVQPVQVPLAPVDSRPTNDVRPHCGEVWLPRD
jgi:hypothetical protein